MNFTGQLRTHTHTHARTHMYTHVHVQCTGPHTHTHAQHICAHIRAHTHTCAHTHTPLLGMTDWSFLLSSSILPSFTQKYTDLLKEFLLSINGLWFAVSETLAYENFHWNRKLRRVSKSFLQNENLPCTQTQGTDLWTQEGRRGWGALRERYRTRDITVCTVAVTSPWEVAA